MQDSNGPENKKEQDLAESNSEATSKELLSDVEGAEKDTGSSSSEPEPGPSPDGAFDESDERKDSGPM
ncbi:MAG: hypothetical protein ACR2H4_07680 [Pyrinomonadaceae bacterium]